MAKLPKSIIKKYGITKKAWSIFRGKKMGKKRKRTGFKGFFKRKSGGGSVKIIQPNAILYGAVRNPIASKMPQIAMAGNYSDELAMGILSWAAAKYGGGGFIREAGMAGLTCENANVGAGLASNLTGASTSTAAYLLG